MTPLPNCPWWCDDHRTGETVEDEQHARLFAAPDGAWVAILRGALPTDAPELACRVESYDLSSGAARHLARSLADAADVFDRARTEPPVR